MIISFHHGFIGYSIARAIGSMKEVFFKQFIAEYQLKL